MKELYDDFFKCKICHKEIPTYFQQGHAAVCQQDANSWLHLTKTAIGGDTKIGSGGDEESLTIGNELSAIEKE